MVVHGTWWAQVLGPVLYPSLASSPPSHTVTCPSGLQRREGWVSGLVSFH